MSDHTEYHLARDLGDGNTERLPGGPYQEDFALKAALDMANAHQGTRYFLIPDDGFDVPATGFVRFAGQDHPLPIPPQPLRLEFFAMKYTYAMAATGLRIVKGEDGGLRIAPIEDLETSFEEVADWVADAIDELERSDFPPLDRSGA